MPTEGGPWGREPLEAAKPPPPDAGRPRLMLRGQPAGLWLLFLAGIGVLVFALIKAFPETRLGGDDWRDIGWYAGLMLLLAAGGFRLGTGRFRQGLRHAVLFLALFAGVVLVYAYRDLFADLPQRLSLALGTARPTVVGDRELVVPQDEQGAFEVIARVDGQPVRFMVDTGSSDTVLSPDDARRLGADLSALPFRTPAETANGIGYSAPWKVRRIEVGPIAFDDLPVSINQAPMTRSLLGRDFLGRLESYQVRGRSLYLKWKDPAGAGKPS